MMRLKLLITLLGFLGFLFLRLFCTIYALAIFPFLFILCIVVGIWNAELSIKVFMEVYKHYKGDLK